VSVNAPLARRMPGFDARHATRRARRTRVAAAFVIVLALAASLVFFLGRGQKNHPPAASSRHHGRSVAAPRIVASLATWRLGAPISRAVVVADPVPASGRLIILGGATTGGLTASGAFALDVTTGTLTHVGDLITTLDDAAGAVLDGRDVVFGGASSALSPASASVQALPAAPTTGPASSGAAVPTATTLGSLPQPRAADAAVTTATTTYLVGGDSGAAPEPGVLATADGQHFDVVASLPVPVRFPAVAAVGNRLYVFGGLAAAGPDAGRPVDTIQVVDLKTHKVSDSWHLPEPLSGAAAAVLGHDILLAGGDTSASAAVTKPGAAGTTTAPPPSTSSVSTVWFFDPASGHCRPVGQLPVPVSHAGVAVLGTTAWLVGGESDGTAVSAVQSVAAVPDPS